MITEILKPCPFCDGAVSIRLSNWRGWQIDCGGCHAAMQVGFMDDRELTIVTWNRRGQQHNDIGSSILPGSAESPLDKPPKP